MELSCPLGTTRGVPQEKNFPERHKINPLLTKFVLLQYWPRSFFARLWTSTPSWSINSQKIELIYLDCIVSAAPHSCNLFSRKQLQTDVCLNYSYVVFLLLLLHVPDICR